jgi:hypothetical protein
MKFKHSIFIIIITVLSNSCAFVQEEVDIIDIEELTNSSEELKIYKSKTVNINSGDKLYFWSELDMEYEGNVNLYFQVEIANDKGESLMLIEMDALDIDTRVMCIETTSNNKTNYSCTGRIHNFTSPEEMDFVEFEDSGEYSFNVIMFANSYEKIDIKKSKLILKK